MGRLAIVIVAFLLFESCTAISALSPSHKKHCFFHRESDEIDSCILGFMATKCQTLKCLKTVGQSCSHNEEDQKLYGERCGENLKCGCDKKCSGCMTVNGKKLCHDDTFFCLSPSFGKRSEVLMDTQEELDYPAVDNRMVN